MKLRLLIAATIIVPLIGLNPLTAQADIYVDNVQLPYGEYVNLDGNIDGSPYSDHNQLAGQIVLTVNDGNSGSGIGQYTLPVWCVDIFHDITLGGTGYRYSEGPLSTDNDSINPSALNSSQMDEILALATYGNHLMQITPPNDLDEISAEVQAAIWTVEYNGPNNVGGSNTLTVTSGSFNSGDIDALITAAAGYGGSGGQLIALNGAQAEVFDAPPVPEPASFGLLGAGLFGLGVIRRRRQMAACHSAST